MSRSSSRPTPSRALRKAPEQCLGPVQVVWEDIRGVSNVGVSRLRSDGEMADEVATIEGATLLSFGYIASRSSHSIVLVNHWCPQERRWWYWDRIPADKVTTVTVLGRLETFRGVPK